LVHARQAVCGAESGWLGALVLNPLRSEDEAFRFLLYAIVVILVIVGAILGLRAIF
jgi:hypothetical protein